MGIFLGARAFVPVVFEVRLEVEGSETVLVEHVFLVAELLEPRRDGWETTGVISSCTSLNPRMEFWLSHYHALCVWHHINNLGNAFLEARGHW